MKREFRAWLLLPLKNRSDGNVVVTIEVVPKLVPHHKAELRFVEGFEKARREHDEKTPLLRLHASSVKMWARVHIGLERDVHPERRPTMLGHLRQIR